MTTYTPGKWEAIHDADGDYAIFAGRKIVAITDKDSEEDRANARLIAASPGLLEALKLLCFLIRETNDIFHDRGIATVVISGTFEAAEKAIAQAQEGK